MAGERLATQNALRAILMDHSLGGEWEVGGGGTGDWRSSLCALLPECFWDALPGGGGGLQGVAVHGGSSAPSPSARARSPRIGSPSTSSSWAGVRGVGGAGSSQSGLYVYGGSSQSGHYVKPTTNTNDHGRGAGQTGWEPSSIAKPEALTGISAASPRPRSPPSLDASSRTGVPPALQSPSPRAPLAHFLKSSPCIDIV